MAEPEAPTIPGADQLVDWFGFWPSFHDAEILELHLDRNSKSFIRIHTWLTNNEVDASGRFISDRHVVVTFWLERIVALSLWDFNSQNVISGVDIGATPAGHRVKLCPCYGLSGDIEAEKVSVTLEPGKPESASPLSGS
jgi:hypothetical protein